jgi:hypothetical protein
MTPEILEKICKPYGTFNNNNMNSYGTGIGLYSSQILVGVIGPIQKIFVKSVLG